MKPQLVAVVVQHIGTSRPQTPIFDQKNFDQNGKLLLNKALSLRQYRGSAKQDLFYPSRRIRGDGFAENGDLFSPIIIMCKEALTSAIGAHNNGGGFKCNAFNQNKLAQTMYNFVKIVRCLEEDKLKTAFSFDNILVKPLSSNQSKEVSMDSGGPGIEAAMLVVQHNLDFGAEVIIGTGQTAGTGCTKSLNAIAANVPTAQCITIEINISGPLGPVKMPLTVLANPKSRPVFSIETVRHLSKITSTNESVQFWAALIPFALLLTGHEVNKEVYRRLANCLLSLPKSPPPFDSESGAASGGCLSLTDSLNHSLTHSLTPPPLFNSAPSMSRISQANLEVQREEQAAQSLRKVLAPRTMGAAETA